MDNNTGFDSEELAAAVGRVMNTLQPTFDAIIQWMREFYKFAQPIIRDFYRNMRRLAKKLGLEVVKPVTPHAHAMARWRKKQQVKFARQQAAKRMFEAGYVSVTQNRAIRYVDEYVAVDEQTFWDLASKPRPPASTAIVKAEVLPSPRFYYAGMYDNDKPTATNIILPPSSW